MEVIPVWRRVLKACLEGDVSRCVLKACLEGDLVSPSRLS